MELNHQQMWERCLKIFKDNVSPEQYDAWFAPVTSLSYTDGKLTIGVPSQYFKETLEEKYLKLMKFTLRRVYGDNVKLYYSFMVVNSDPESTVKMTGDNISPEIRRRPGITANPFQPQVQDEIDSQLNPRYNFDNYCPGDCNLIAHTMGKKIASDPNCKTYNPLYIFGPPGVGKTHLAQAIGIGIKETTPTARVLYVTARLFESQYTAANARGKINEFIAFYQSIDALIVDDIQDLMGKEKTQRTFFHIFNHLHLNERQLILTSDVRPSEMENMEERLLSRFKWGATAELKRPDYELRRNVLRQKAEQDGLDIPADVLDYIAANVTDSIRELEGVVVSLIAHAMATGRNVDLGLAKSVLANAVKITRRQINFEMIAMQVSQHYGIEPDLIFTKNRKREINDARQMVMYLAKKLTKMPLTNIGTRLSRTHATVLHGCQNIEDRLMHETQLQSDVAAIESALRTA